MIILFRSPIFLFLLLMLTASFSSNAQNLTVFKAKSSMDATVERLIKVMKERGFSYLETVKQDEITGAKSVALSPIRIVYFEDSDLCAKLISCQSTASLDLPLKIIVWEEEGDIYIGYMDPVHMKKRFMIAGCDDVLAKLTGIHVRLVNEVLRDH